MAQQCYHRFAFVEEGADGALGFGEPQGAFECDQSSVPMWLSGKLGKRLEHQDVQEAPRTG